MILAHKIRLDPNKDQIKYFIKACGTARFTWNWALAEWKKQYLSGEKPTAMKLKKQFNENKYTQYPWLLEIHRDAHSQPFANLGKAYSRFFQQVKTGKDIHEPVFKHKGQRESFYISNDKFETSEKKIRLPKIGWVQLRECLRLPGVLKSATVSRTANKWYVSIQVDVPEAYYKRHRNMNNVVGIDLGLNAFATLSSGEKIIAPKPLKKALRRLQIASRRCSKKQKGSQNKKKAASHLAIVHARITNIRRDFLHKLTTCLCSENQAIGYEDLAVKNMIKNHKLARSISDVAWGEFCRQLLYKADRYNDTLVQADRFYPSSKLCHICGFKIAALPLKVRTWVCPQCRTTHDRDFNASKNLEGLALLKNALPSARGKVTLVRDESIRRGSGQEQSIVMSTCAH